VALGRQRVGKTVMLSTTVQYFRALGCHIEVWNADQQNRTHSLSTFFPDALTPPAGGVADTKQWIEQRLIDQARGQFHAALDAGGGFNAFGSLVDEVPILGTLEERGIDTVAFFCVGPEKADLDYLEQYADGESFLPKATVIVLNAGLVLSGRSASGAFAPVLDTKVVSAALARGAKVVTMPALPCMSEVTDRGLTFEEAAAGAVKPGQEPMSMFDPTRVNEWWTKKVPRFFGQLPPKWLPLSEAGDVAAEPGGESS
jgi:hypothetical protein